MAALAGELPDALIVAVEFRPQGGQFPHPGRAFGDEDVDRGPVAQSGARRQGVGRVQGDGVTRVADIRLGVVQDRGHSPLGPLGRGVRQGAFGEDADAQAGRHSGGARRRGEASDAAADDQQVEGGGVGWVQGWAGARPGEAVALFHWSTWTTVGV